MFIQVDSESGVRVCVSEWECVRELLAALCCMPIFSHSLFEEQIPCCHGDSLDLGDARLGISDELMWVISSKVTFGLDCEFRHWGASVICVFRKISKKNPKNKSLPFSVIFFNKMYVNAGTFFKARFALQARKSPYFS